MNKEVYPESYINVKSICPNWITDNFLDFMNLKLEELNGKNITSIGWWFWIFEMDAAKQWAKVTIVDPMFTDENSIKLKLQENINWMKGKIKRKGNETFEWIKDDIMETLKECKDEQKRLEFKEKLDWYNERQAERKEYIHRREILLDHLNNWDENQKKYWLILNPSSWNDIEWIEPNSQDIVIVAHTLWHIFNKSTVDILDFFSEALKLLKPEWKLYIIDYIWDIMEMDKILEKSDMKMYYKVNKWSFVCCFDKEWLSKFIKKELQ